MRRLEPVIWTKGTFLNPQHLQSQDRFLEETLQFQLQALQFRPWGFQRLRLDQTALAAGTLAVVSGIVVVLIGLFLWLMHWWSEHRKLEDCYLSGRRNCEPIPIER